MLNEVKSAFGGKTTIIIFALVILNLNLLSQWQLTAGTGTAYGNTLYCIGDTLFAGTDFGAYKTTNNGNTWITINNGFTAPTKVMDFSYADSLLWCAAYNNGVFYSSNFGNSWIRENSNSITKPLAIVAIGNYVFISNDASGNHYVFYSSNMGTNWVRMNQGNYPTYVLSFTTNGNILFAGDGGSFDPGCYYSFLGGTSWTQINGNLTGNSHFVNEIRYKNNKLYIATYGGIWSSSNNGTNWVNLNSSLSNTNIWSLHTLNSNIFIGTWNSKIYFSSNEGNSWYDVSIGIPANVGISEITSNSAYAFALLYETGTVYRRPLAELIGIQSVSSEIPKQYSLSQNYPNPFNPITNINFEIKEKADVKLTVFNTLGEEVATLVNQNLSPGTYKVDWNASNFPSGVYYYKINTESFSETKKMILIK